MEHGAWSATHVLNLSQVAIFFTLATRHSFLRLGSVDSPIECMRGKPSRRRLYICCRHSSGLRPQASSLKPQASVLPPPDLCSPRPASGRGAGGEGLGTFTNS
ncbi:hypothetical protein VN12_00935 [Pirellula sp. SH-Sr6A]|nr:hypothetical protein VN12_00935 [Pirellula sp. SH-Sr6A]